MKRKIWIPLACLLVVAVCIVHFKDAERFNLFGASVREDKITNVTLLLREYDECASRADSFMLFANDEKNEEKAHAFVERAEIAHLEMFSTFQELACAYDALTEKERIAFFAIAGNDAPRGYGALPSLNDPLKDFEAFLMYSFSEIDYMSAFSIPTEEHEGIKERYRTLLRKKGIAACQ